MGRAIAFGERRVKRSAFVVSVVIGVFASHQTATSAPHPVLKTVFPAGGQAGTSLEVKVAGDALDKLTSLHCSHPGISFVQRDEENQFLVTIPAEVPPGLYDLRAAGQHGLSSPRTFFVSRRNEQLEAEPNGAEDPPQAVPLDTVVNGRIQEKGDVDRYEFTAQRGQRVVLECWVERIDSPLRPVLDLLNERGQSVPLHRSHVGLDPAIIFDVPHDGTYVAQLSDLVHGGSGEHVYWPRSIPGSSSQKVTCRRVACSWNNHVLGSAGCPPTSGQSTSRIPVAPVADRSSGRACLCVRPRRMRSPLPLSAGFRRCQSLPDE